MKYNFNHRKAGLSAFTILFLAFPFPVAAAGLQLLSGHVPAAVAAGAPQTGRLSASKHLWLAIALPWRHQDELQKLIQQIYDPASPQFHQYLSTEQFTQRFGPAQEDYQAVVDFLNSKGLKVTGTHKNRLLVDADGAVADIEQAFHVEMHYYQRKDGSQYYAPDREPSLELATPLQHIGGLDNFNPPHPNFKTRPLNSTGPKPALSGSGTGGCSGCFIGNDLRDAYVPGVAFTGTGQVSAIVAVDGYLQSDISAYESVASLPNVTLQNVYIDGFDGTVHNPPNGENSLDLEQQISMAPGLSKIMVYEGSNSIDDDLNQAVTDNVAKTCSVSYIWGPDTTLSQIGQEFAAQGQSLFIASGDGGAYIGGTGGDSSNENPYVTMVGGTDLSTTGPGGSWLSESAWVDGGGGIGNDYSIPSYQQGVSMATNQGSSTQRNVPDVSMNANFTYLIIASGENLDYIGGTSAATPLWAAFTALANEAASNAGKPSVGFINPAIYAIGQGSHYGQDFHDITSGNNANTSSGGFNAVPGYDLCTGWGTPAGQDLINDLSQSSFPTLTPTLTPTPVVASSWRIRAGGPAYTDCQGNVWTADENYSGGSTNSSSSSISNALPCSTDQPLYQDERWGSPSFSYTFNVPAGSYQVTLKFAELFDNGAGQRLINVSINGAQVLSSFDIFADSGGLDHADDKVFNNIVPSGGKIVIQFSSAAGSPDSNCKVDALQVIPQPVFAPCNGSAMTLDGHLNESVWSLPSFTSIPSSDCSYATGCGSTDTNASAQFKTIWNPGGLWIGVQVSDPATLYANAAAPWNGSAVEIFLDLYKAQGGYNSSTGDYNDSNTYQWIITYNSNSIVQYHNATARTISAASVTTTGTGYTMEIEIPWSNLTGLGAPGAGAISGLNVAVDVANAAGTARDHQIVAYNGSVSPFDETPADWGTLQYLACVIPTPTPSFTLSMTPTRTPSFTPSFTPTTTPPVCASWVVDGSAFVSGKGVTLTSAANSEAGSAWNSICINLNQNFNMTFMTYFGASGGADGIDFVLQNDPRGISALGSSGSNKGYAGTGAISPSVALDLETYNSNGTLQVLENGSTASTCAYAASACPYLFAANIANQSEHSYQVVWNASAKTLTLIFDGVSVMTYNRDLVNAVFGGNTCAYYGFTAGTGGANNLQYVYEVGCSVPTPTPTSTRSATMTWTPTATASGTPSASPTPTLTATPSATGSPTHSPNPTFSDSPSLTPTPSFSESATLSSTETGSPSVTKTITVTMSPTLTITQTPTPTRSQSPTVTLTGSMTLSPSITVSPSLSETSSLTASFTATMTPSLSASASPTLSLSPSMTNSASPTFSPSFSESATVSSTETGSPSATETGTETTSPTWTATPTETPTPSQSPTATVTNSMTPSPTITATPTSSETASATSSLTYTDSPTATVTATSSASQSASPSFTPSLTVTPTSSATRSPTEFISPTISPIPSLVRTASPSVTPTLSPVLSAKPTTGHGSNPGNGKVQRVLAIPNPQRGPIFGFDLQLSGSANQIQAKLFDRAMMLVAQTDFQGSWVSGWNRLNWQIPGLHNGIYYVVFSTDQGQQGKVAVLMVIE